MAVQTESLNNAAEQTQLEVSFFGKICIIFFLSLAAAILVGLVGVIIQRLFKKRVVNGEARPRYPFLLGCLVLFISVLFMQLAVNVYQCYTNPEYNVRHLNLLFISIVNALQTFSMDADYDNVIGTCTAICSSFFPSCALPRLFFTGIASVQNIASPITGGAIIFDILINFFPGVRLFWRTKLKKHPVYFFSQLNPSSFAMAKSILQDSDQLLPPTIVFADTDPKADEQADDVYTDLTESAKQIKAICIKKDLTHLQYTIKGPRTFFLMDEQQLNNLKTLILAAKNDSKKMMAKAEVYLFTDNQMYDRTKDTIEESLVANGYLPRDRKDTDLPSILPVRSYQNLVFHLLTEVPLFEPLLPARAAGGDTSVLRVAILGSGFIGTEMLLDAYWCGQLSGTRLELHVLSCEEESAFYSKLDALNPELRKSMRFSDSILRINGRGEMAAPYAALRYHKVDLQSDELQELFTNVPVLKETHYFVVALGSDEVNIRLSEVLRHELGRYHLELAAKGDPNPRHTVIAYAVYEPKLCAALNQHSLQSSCHAESNDLYLHAFGSLEAEFSVDNIMMPELSSGAEEMDSLYLQRTNSEQRRKLLGQERRNYYKLWTNIARVTHTKYKMFAAGLKLPTVFLPESHDPARCAAARKSRWNAAFEAFKLLECTDAAEFSGEQKAAFQAAKTLFAEGRLPENGEALRTIQNVDAWLEHRRWNAYMRSGGYRRTVDSAVYYDRTQDHKDLTLLLHPCLLECDQNGMHDDLQAAMEAEGADKTAFDLLDQLTYNLRFEQKTLTYDFKKYDYTRMEISRLERYFRFTVLDEKPARRKRCWEKREEKRQLELRVRVYRVEDAEDLAAWCSIPCAVCVWNSAEHPEVPADEAAVRARYDACRDSDSLFPLTVLAKKERIVGQVLLRKETDNPKRVIIEGIILDPALADGIAGREIMKQACKYAFDVLGAKQVSVTIADQHSDAARMCLEAGFETVKDPEEATADAEQNTTEKRTEMTAEEAKEKRSRIQWGRAGYELVKKRRFF